MVNSLAAMSQMMRSLKRRGETESAQQLQSKIEAIRAKMPKPDAPLEIVFSDRPKGNFCYFTGSNRQSEPPMIKAMIDSARAVGVKEDFHVFATAPVDGAINHAESVNFDNFMFKVKLLDRLKDLDYEYFVFLDSDNFFVRDPGDLSDLIRGNDVWVSMEGDLTTNACKNWWGLGSKGRSVADEMRLCGVTGERIYNTNAGMFIVRKSAIVEFVRRMYEIKAAIVARGITGVTEEPPLAVLGHLMLADSIELNTVPNHSHVWACDWTGQHRQRGRLPNGHPWKYRDWVTQKDLGTVNPAIVHVMSAKGLMIERGRKSGDNIRKLQVLDAFPCVYRGDEKGIMAKNGGCSVEASPCFGCTLATNKTGKATLWRYCTTQAEPICQRCNDRTTEKTLAV